MDADYTILKVEKRKEWISKFGEMQDYAIHIQQNGNHAPEPGWIQLTQKLTSAPPREGWTLHGHIETSEHNGSSYKKFKKVSPDGQGNRSGGFGDSGGGQAPSGNGVDGQQLEYIIQMLEELTGRRDEVHDQKDTPTNSGNAGELPEEDPFAGLL